MKILGHPLHIMLIHFPSALFPMDFMCSLRAFYIGDIYLASTSFYCMMAGAAFGGLAVITGTLDLAGVAVNKPKAIKKTLIHGGINVSVVIAYSILAFIAFKKYPLIVQDDATKLILKGALITFMIVGNYLGGSLILKDKVGIDN
jgi:uncharacterized membrane protein